MRAMVVEVGPEIEQLVFENLKRIHRLGRKALGELAAVAKPDTLLAWYRKLIANKFEGSKLRKSWGRPRVDEETQRLVVQMAKVNLGWGYDRIAGAMAT
jgi:putative transposase